MQLYSSELQSELNAAAVGLNTASSEVVQTVDRPVALGDSSRQFGDAFNRLLGVSMEMAGRTEVRRVSNKFSCGVPQDTILSPFLFVLMVLTWYGQEKGLIYRQSDGTNSILRIIAGSSIIL